MNALINRDGPAVRALIRAGQQEVLPTLLRSRQPSGNTTVNLLAFDLMKDLPATVIIMDARARGLLRPGQPVVDSSSGSFGMGISRVCQTLGHPCHVVGDVALAGDLQAGLEARGATVHVVDAPPNANDLQALRKDLRDDIARTLDAFVPDQYGSPLNPASYEAAAELALATSGPVDILVVAVGSGGSSAGLARALRRVNPAMKLVGVDTFGSILFGLPPGVRDLRGLGNGILPPNLDTTLFDRVDWMAVDVACEGVLRIQEAGLGDRGLTSGATWMVAEALASRAPSANVMAVTADLGFRYRDQIADYRLRRNEDFRPRRVRRLAEAAPPWAWIDWGRRSRADVMAREAGAAG